MSRIGDSGGERGEDRRLERIPAGDPESAQEPAGAGSAGVSVMASSHLEKTPGSAGLRAFRAGTLRCPFRPLQAAGATSREPGAPSRRRVRKGTLGCPPRLPGTAACAAGPLRMSRASLAQLPVGRGPVRLRGPRRPGYVALAASTASARTCPGRRQLPATASRNDGGARTSASLAELQQPTAGSRSFSATRSAARARRRAAPARAPSCASGARGSSAPGGARADGDGHRLLPLLDREGVGHELVEAEARRDVEAAVASVARRMRVEAKMRICLRASSHPATYQSPRWCEEVVGVDRALRGAGCCSGCGSGRGAVGAGAARRARRGRPARRACVAGRGRGSGSRRGRPARRATSAGRRSWILRKALARSASKGVRRYCASTSRTEVEGDDARPRSASRAEARSWAR